jgi:hypothetical protein
VRAAPAPKHELLHRLKRLSRWLSNEQEGHRLPEIQQA